MALKNLLFFLVLTSLVAFATASRTNIDFSFSVPGYNLTGRLETNPAEIIDCWKSLLQLNSCSFAAIEFFLTGNSALSSKCCSAIELSKSECSPSGYAAVGFTNLEGSLLSAYCGSGAPVPAPALSPA